TRCSDGEHGHANDHQTDEKPNPACSTPVKRKKNCQWCDEQRNEYRDRNCKITRTTFKRRDMHDFRQNRAQTEAEEQPRCETDDSSEDPEKNCADTEFLRRGLHRRKSRRIGRHRLLKKIDAFMCLSDFDNEPRIIPTAE